MSDRDSTKYGSDIADHDWSKPETEIEQPDRTSVDTHKIEVIYVTDPSEDMGYGREKYTLNIRYDDDTGEPYVLFAIKHRWKGNYWRDVLDLDWKDVPYPVKERVVSLLPVERVGDLATENRLIPEGGESRFEKYHKPRMDSMESGEMFGTSFLRDAVRSLESAAESFEDGSKGHRMSERVIGILQKTVTQIESHD